MGNISFDIDKKNTFELVKQLNQAEKEELVKKLQEEASGTPQSQPVNGVDADSYIEILRKTYDYGQEEFDKNILYISSSALGLTLAFIDKVVKLDAATCKWYLWIGWVVLGSTILVYVFSHLASANVQLALIDKTRKLPEKDKKNVLENAGIKSFRKAWRIVIIMFNFLLYGGMLAGIIFIMIFLYHNLLK